MPKEIFDQPLITGGAEPQDNDRFALGLPGLTGGKNITWKSLKTLIGGFGEVITVDTVEIWDVAKIYQPNKIVAYSSDNVPFVTPKLYRALAFTTPGQSPETNPELWYNEGDTITVSASNTNTTFVANLNALKAITGMKTSDSVIVYEDGSGYSFDELDETGVKANDASAGSWIYRNRFNLGNVIAAIFTVSAFSKIYRMPNIDDTVIVLAIGDVQIFGGVTITTTEPCFIVRKTLGNTVGDFEVVSFGSGGSSGHTIKDSAGTTLPTQPVLKFGAGLTVVDGTGETVVSFGGLASIGEETNEAIREIEKYEDGNNVFNYTTGALYEYDSAETETDDNDNFLKPNDLIGIGRWVKRQDFVRKSDVALRIVNIEEGSNIILDADSGNTYFRYKGASPITVSVANTIPLALPFAINQMGVGKITLQGAAGVVLTTANLKTGGQGFGVTIMKVANNLVDVIGGIE